MDATKYQPAYGHNFNVEHLVVSEGYNREDASAEVTMQELIFAVGVRTCKKIGHRWMDESYGGPDRGHMGACCMRCGYSFHHILY